MNISSFKYFFKRYKIYRKFLYISRSRYKEYFKVFSSLNKNSVFVDLGANIGDVTQFVNDVSNNCKISCYEPHPGAYLFLKNRFKNYSNISIFEKAVSNSSKRQKFFFHQSSESEMHIATSKSTSLYADKSNVDSSKFVIVDTVTVEDIMSIHDHIDIIKIDIEGAEYQIIPDLVKYKERISKVVCELHGKINSYGHNPHPNFNKDYSETINFLKEKKLYGDWFIEWH